LSNRIPSVSLAAVPGRRAVTLDLAAEIEERGFSGIYCPSFGDAMGLCQGIAERTSQISFGTSIANIYTRHPHDYASSASFIHEISNGRFLFGVGVSHGPMNDRLSLTTGKPLSDMQNFVQIFKEAKRVGELPPIIIAAMRDRMMNLGAEISDGVVLANGARSALADSLERMRQNSNIPDSFFIGGMIPTCISEDREAAAAVNRKTLMMYVNLPNYRNYWKASGYQKEMESIEEAISQKNYEAVPNLMTDDWLSDVTLYGSATEVKEGLEKWYDAGLENPILVPSSTSGGQFQAFQELFALFT
tara:strand:- start:34756 stop:35664 length:909 start_codon:yes stop_codon:yes gene_type:complete